MNLNFWKPKAEATIEPVEAENQAAVEVAELERIAALPLPIANVPAKAERGKSYEEMAQQLGFCPAELIAEQLKEFLAENDIGVYKYGEVSKWMTNKCREVKVEKWCWRPLREKDRITEYLWGYNSEKRTYNDGYYADSQWECRPYARLVPLHALEKVAKIEARFGDQVKFFVSDYARADPDPFILAQVSAMSDNGTNRSFIFDHWDKPGFGEK